MNIIKRAAPRLLFSAVFVSGMLIMPRISRAERITSFSSQVAIGADASVRVTEAIVYDFEGAARHGIFRSIPVEYARSGANYALRFSDIAVRDAEGRSYRFDAYREGANEIVKIGDPGLLVSGVHVYIISYKVERAINYFGDHDEFYWNATGNGWAVPMESVNATVAYPAAAVSFSCFVGAAGSVQKCPEVSSAGNNTLHFAGGRLESGQGLTVVLGFPKGALAKPSPGTAIWYFVGDNRAVAIPVLALIAMYVLWYRFGRDPRGKGTIVPRYDPPELAPAEIGFIMHENLRDSDISATIIHLATRGYLKITRSEAGIFHTADYTFARLNPDYGALNDFERMLMGDIFAGISGEMPAVALSNLKNKFYANIGLLKKKVAKSLVEQGYFSKDPAAARMPYQWIGGGLLLLAFVASGKLNLQPITLVSLFIAAGIVYLGSFFMAQRTEKGVAMKEYISGFKDYLGTVEADRLKFADAPEKKPERFEKLLAYAMVLGVEKEWGAQFAGIYTQLPRWYAAYPPYAAGNFTAGVFAHDMRDFASKSAALVANPAGGGKSGFGGGGFSGGGFGGGGGSSW